MSKYDIFYCQNGDAHYTVVMKCTSAIIILAILSLYHYLVPYVMYFYHETNMKYVSYRLREINDFDFDLINLI